MADHPRATFEDHDCINCGVRFGVPIGYTEFRRKDKKYFYCPNGHAMSYTESEADKLRRELDKAKQNAAYLNDEIKRQSEMREHAERQAAAAKGVATKLRNRAAAGVCPCCNRTFAQLARHMNAKHPEFKTAEVIPLEKKSNAQ